MEGISRILEVCKSFPQMHLSPSLLVSVHLKWSIVIIVWLRNLCSSFPNSSAGCNRGSLLGHSHTANNKKCYGDAMQVSIIIYYLLSIYYLSICFGLPALWKNLDNSVRLGENSPAYLFPHQMRKLSEFPVNSNVSFSHVMRSMKVESTRVYQGIAGHLVWSDS